MKEKYNSRDNPTSPSHDQNPRSGACLPPWGVGGAVKTRLATMSWVAAMVFAATSLFLPPTGKIDSSVLVLVAQLLVLVATFLGVDSYRNTMGK